MLGAKGETAQGKWSLAEAKAHINVLELRTIEKAIEFLAVKDQTIVVWSDNQVSISVVQKLGSHSPDLQRLAARILKLTLLRNLQLLPRHIEGKRNVAADALSRDQPIPAEWELSEEEFRSLQTQHGAVLEVDLLASPLNFKLQKFFCPFRHPLAEAVDALAQDWSRFKQVWLFPPPNLIGLVAEKLRAYQGGGC